MPHILEDRVLESTTSTGTGAITLAGAVTGFRRFNAVCAVGDTVPYFIEAVDSVGLPTGDYEYGVGTYSAADTLTRTTVLGSSNAGAAVNFTAGSKNVGIGLNKSEIVRPGQCVFKYVSTIQCRLDPCNGNRIIVGGKEMRIPAAGVTVSNGGLAVSTLYYAYAYDNAGTLALEFSTAAPTDAASGLDAWGNRNKTGDTSRTLVGAVYTNASALFSYDKANRLVRSWFNDEGVTAEGIYASNVNFGSGPWSELHASFRALVLMWAGEQFKAEGSAVCHDAGGGAGSMYGSIGLNGVQVGRQGIVTTAGNQIYRTCGFGHASSVASDGANMFTLMGGIAAGGTPQYLGGYCSYTVNTSRKH